MNHLNIMRRDMTTTYNALMSTYSLRYDLQLLTNNKFRVMNYRHKLFCNRTEEGSYLIGRNVHVCNARSNKLGYLKLLFINIKMIKSLRQTHHILMCEVTCFGPYATIIRTSCESSHQRCRQLLQNARNRALGLRVYLLGAFGTIKIT
jgi:hypothetical protein